jgi:hypothetical protein
MKSETFRLGLKAVASVTPYAKKLSDDEIAFLFMTMPTATKRAVTDEMWAYACSQYRMDPSPSKDLPLDQLLLSYVYRVRDSRPAFDWGLKVDLKQRMLNGDRFHAEAALPPLQLQQLPPVSNPALEGLF